MKRSQLKRIEKICVAAICVLIVVILFCIFKLNQDKRTPDGAFSTAQQTESTEQNLAEEADFYPTNLQRNKQLPGSILSESGGGQKTLSDYKGDFVMLTFWAGWCDDCKAELAKYKEFGNVITQYPQVKQLLINRTDGEKETKSSAEQYLSEHGIKIENLFDQGEALYKKIGIQQIPTTIFLNPEGKVVFCQISPIETESQLKAILNYVTNGAAKDTERFVTEKMTDENGGIISQYEKDDSVLSESQGIIMEYAVQTGNKALFEKAYSYVKKYLNQEGLTLWKYGGNDATCNALLDDLRIEKALRNAEKKWGGLAAELKEKETAVLSYNTSKNEPVDFYDWKSKQKAERFTLCYGDLEEIAYLKDSALYENTKKIIEEGYISDQFPFYYNYYDYKEKRYNQDPLNMSEALYTAYHLAQTGNLKEQTLKWIKANTKSGGIKARYTVDGKVVKDYSYESTAVYALVGLIALEVDDPDLLTRALYRMEKARQFDEESESNGAFGGQDGGDLYSFDQCMPLLLYSYMSSRL